MMAEKTNLIGSLVEFQKEITNPPNSATNPFFHSKYAPLPEILNLVRPLLSKQGLALIQDTGTCEDGNVYVKTILFHTSGESLESGKLVLKPEKDKHGKETPQKLGSAITYGRRYQLATFLGISSEDDDDANIASGNKEKTKTPAKIQPQKQQKRQKRQPKASQPKASKKEEDEPGEPETMDMTGGGSSFDAAAQKNPTVKALIHTLKQGNKVVNTGNIVSLAKTRQEEGLINKIQLKKVQKDLGVLAK
jgi:hypothetical protein